MKTAIVGRVSIKLFWRCAFSSGKIQPFSLIKQLGNLLIYKVVYPKNSPFSKEYYKPKVIEFLRQRFDVRWEKTPIPIGDGGYWHSVYSKIDGGYIGRPEEAYKYYQIGLRMIQKAHPENKVCSIAYSPKTSKWVGWSHRAMCGFKIGDIVKEGDCCASSGWTKEYLKEHPEKDYSLPVGFEAKTEVDTKRMAIAFADSVG